jgi:hypothetical protein
MGYVLEDHPEISKCTGKIAWMWLANQQLGKFTLLLNTLISDSLMTYNEHMQLTIFNGHVAMIGNALYNGRGKAIEQTPTYHVVQLYAQSI